VHDIQAQLATPRLVKGAHGFWYLGRRNLVRLEAGAVGPDGALRPEVRAALDAAGVDDPPALPEYSLTVLTATACNLGCGYCFQNVAPDAAGGSQPPRIEPAWLTRRTAARILRFASVRMAESGQRRLHIHLFGGEPLLNPAGCRTLLEQAAEHGLSSARMTSNATLLTPVLAQQLSALGLDSVQVTFDGNRVVHDRVRVRRNGGATFDTILANMARASEASRLRWQIRVNVSSLNRAGVPDLLGEIAERVDPARCHVSFARVNDIGVGFSSTVGYGAGLVDEFAGWSIQAHRLGFGIYPPRSRETCVTCGFRDGRLGATVNADGTLYSCWESAGKPGWEVGSTETGYLPSEVTDPHWVACGYQARAEDPAAAARFQDAVDGQILDYLHGAGRLHGAGQGSGSSGGSLGPRSTGSRDGGAPDIHRATSR
jgi:uncharacterized protein